MNVTIITPPLVQLNSPYPSGAYLSAFFKESGHNAAWLDLSIELYYALFSRAGLAKLFALSEKAALELADKAEKQGDDSTAFNIRRYISTKQSWINWIDDINAILCGRAREKEHQFLFSPYAPRGSRMEGFLSSLQHEPSVDDVRCLCTYALADLADYITAVFDHEFSLIRYAEHLTVDERDFATIEEGLESPVLEHFYKPLLEEKFGSIECPDLLCISIPFAGTFLSALYTARYFKQRFGKKLFISFGGGFVNTELRDAKDARLGSYIDGISYDRGYGAYKCLFENSGAQSGLFDVPKKPLYKFRLFIEDSVIEPLWQDEKTEQFEAEVTAKIVPDYSAIDFSRYPRVCDDKNSMHRLWTDGAWVKAYLAHGCYWHKCAFCDTKLDYVCGYKPVDAVRLYEGLLETAESKGVYGIHFVDEALPPASLKKFALLNAQHGNRLYFWGNVRFEKAFSKDLASFLSCCGFGGVSAGLEVATGSGLKSINKGTDVQSIVSACAAFKEAGILVHAYMIYGFWNDTPQTIIDSMETLRQFFAAGLLDSAFWHKFVLTANSTVFAEWQKGNQPDLHPVLPEKAESIFANNNLHFKGENKYDKFGAPLETALDSWMHGEKLEMKVTKWFSFEVPPPTVPKDFIEKCIEKYEAESDASFRNFAQNLDGLFWLGSDPVLISGSMYSWFYLQEEFAADLSSTAAALLPKLKPAAASADRAEALHQISANPKLQAALKSLHNQGLVLV